MDSEERWGFGLRNRLLGYPGGEVLRDETMNRSASAPSQHAVTKSADEELALFLEMRRLVKERNDLLQHNSEEFDSPSGDPLFATRSLFLCTS